MVQTALELGFLAEETERQLDTSINWGRYAEALAYDDRNTTPLPDFISLPSRGA